MDISTWRRTCSSPGQAELVDARACAASRAGSACRLPTADGLNAASVKGQINWARQHLRRRGRQGRDRRQRGGGRAGAQSRRRASADRRHAGLQRARPDALRGSGALAVLPVRPAERHRGRRSICRFPLIRHVDADLRISAPKVAAQGLRPRPRRRHHHGALGQAARRYRRARAATPARSSAQVTANTNEIVPRYTLRGKVENFEAGPAGAALFGATVLTGRSTLSVDVEGAGQTPAEVLRRLSGKAALTMAEGGRVGLDIKALRTAAKANGAAGLGAAGQGPDQSRAGRGPGAHPRRRADHRDGAGALRRHRASPPPGASTWPSARSICTSPSSPASPPTGRSSPPTWRAPRP